MNYVARVEEVKAFSDIGQLVTMGECRTRGKRGGYLRDKVGQRWGGSRCTPSEPR
jgi:hypothetical protein